MRINWVQFKHSYLLGTMLFLSLVLLSDYTHINHLLVLLILVGHTLLAIKQNTAAYVMDLLFGKKVKAESQILKPNKGNLINPQDISSYISETAPFQLEVDHSRTLSFEESVLADKSRHHRMTNLKELIHGKSIQLRESRLRELNQSCSRSRRPPQQQKVCGFLSELDSQQFDMRILKDQQMETLYAERIQPQAHLYGIQRVVRFMAICISDFIFKHDANIEALNYIVVPHFGIEVVETSQQRFPNLQPISLDQVISSAACLRNVNYLRWEWLSNILPNAKLQVLSEFTRLASERADLDNYLYFELRISHPTYRLRAINRLRTIVGEMMPNHGLFNNTRKELSLAQINDKKLLFTFLRNIINRCINPEISNLIRVRWEEYSKRKPSQLLSFVFTQLDSGISQLNIGQKDKLLCCEPGENNIFSAFYMYLYVVKKRYQQHLKYNPQLERIVNRIIV